MDYKPKEAFLDFQVDAQPQSAEPYGSGHINDTFLVKCLDGSRYILQRLNDQIFKDIPTLMQNIVRVTEHIRGKLQGQGCSDIDRRVLTVIPAQNGKSYYLDSDGNHWRLYIFIEKAQTYDVVKNLDQSYQAAKSFGEFQKQLADLPDPPLVETIKDFHNGLSRLKLFEEALKKDEHNRAIQARKEIDFLLDNAKIFDVFPRLIETNQVPVRTTHNDTKINNVMIDDVTNQGVCVIDLDTVMPGLVLYDFGDIIRTNISSAEEDEPDLNKIYVELELFESFTSGYLSSAAGFLNNCEIDHLVHSGKMITLIVGTRFLTDYLTGDTYFKIHSEHHNLQRSRAQFKRVLSITENEEHLNQIVQEIINKIR